MLTVVRFWILFSTLLVGAGWTLSALHQLNRTGYGVVFALAGLAFIIWQRKTGWRPQKNPVRLWHQFRRRCRRPAPLIFFVLAGMTLLGGLLYIQTNGDSEEYRIPRVWHWLAAGGWHWIRTADVRMNIVGCGFEWLCAPLMLFTRTDRWIFLINWVSYLMLPGLIFSVFTRLQVRPRVAWWWMWLLASGWCYIMQAGSNANDAFAAVYALAAVDLALRAQENKSLPDLWLSLLAAALVTGAKQSNAPLVIPWLVAAWPCWRMLGWRPLATALAAAAGLLVSVATLSGLNYLHAGNWQGLAGGTGNSLWSAGTPAEKFVGNLFSIPVQNLLPPFFPWSDAWNAAVARFVETPLGSHFARLERFGQLSEGVSETTAGIGLGIFVLTLVSLWAARVVRSAAAAGAGAGSDARPPGFDWFDYFLWLRLAKWLALLTFMAAICIFADARLLSAYYLLLFPLLLAGPAQERVVRRRWWQRLGVLVLLLAVGVLLLSRHRPLFPAITLTARLKAAHPESHFLDRLWYSYAWKDGMRQQVDYFQKDLPPDATVVGYATVQGMAECGLWRPFGTRRVVRVLAEDTPEQLRAQGLQFVLVDDYALRATHLGIEEWMKRYDGRLTDQLEYDYKSIDLPVRHLYLVRLNPPPAAGP